MRDWLSLWMAPAVMAARLPILWSEALDPRLTDRPEMRRAVTEKMAATAEGFTAAQLELWRAGLSAGLALASGRSPLPATRMGLQRATRAAVAPAARRVRANRQRLARTD